MVAPAAGLPAMPMWPSSMTTTAGSGCPSSRRLPAAVVAEGSQLGALPPHQGSADFKFISDLDAKRMRRGVGWGCEQRTQ